MPQERKEGKKNPGVHLVSKKKSCGTSFKKHVLFIYKTLFDLNLFVKKVFKFTPLLITIRKS